MRFDGTQRYYHHDQLGSTRALTSANGTVVARSDYDPYGNPTTATTPSNPFGYAGQYTDHATGLIYMRARWYDPATGQFITSDPISHASGETNLYRYAGGDPANLTDPSGLLFGIAGDEVSTLAAGFGDGATFGLTKMVRQALGVDNVDYCSSAYTLGRYAGLATDAALGGAGIARGVSAVAGRLAARRGAEVGLRTVTALSREQDASLSAALRDPNKLRHIFGKPGHNLGPLTNELGGQDAVLREAVLAVPRNTTGVFKVSRRLAATRSRSPGVSSTECLASELSTCHELSRDCSARRGLPSHCFVVRDRRSA